MDDVLRAIKFRTQSSVIDIERGRIVLLPLQLWGEQLPPRTEHAVELIPKARVRTFSRCHIRVVSMQSAADGEGGTHCRVDEECSGCG